MNSQSTQTLPCVVRRTAEMSELAESWRRAGATVGLVPTMGALHQGHLSLVRQARRESTRVVVSIFVNPTQFAPHEDLAKYPRTFEQDLELLKPLQIDAVFAPEPEEIYPAGFSTFIEPADVSKPWEGAIRPGHFRGVTTVVMKLLLVSRATSTYFGQKDFQQTVVIRRMIDELNVPCQMSVLPTVRETDGLAMSSRNRYLSPANRQTAGALYRVLTEAQQAIAGGERDGHALSASMNQGLIDAGFDKVDYAAVCEPTGLTLNDPIKFPVVLLAAARISGTRLIDNVYIEGP